MKRDFLVAAGASAATLVVLLVIYSLFQQPLLSSVRSSAPAADFAGSQESKDAGSGQTMLAYSLSLTVKVDSLDQAEAAAKSQVSGLGGYLAGARGSYGDRKSLVLTFQVPSDSLEEAGLALKALGEVDSESLDAYDVKSEYDEFSARIGSLEAERSRLMDFYDRANETSELIEISNRLSYVDSQLTYLNQRKAELEDAVEYSTVYVTLEEKMGAFSEVVLVGLSELFGVLGSGMNFTMRVVFGLAGALLPLALFALLAFGALKAYSSLKSKKG